MLVAAYMKVLSLEEMEQSNGEIETLFVKLPKNKFITTTRKYSTMMFKNTDVWTYVKASDVPRDIRYIGRYGFVGEEVNIREKAETCCIL